MASPSNAGGAVRFRESVVVADWRIAPRTASQNWWASGWLRGTDTKATLRSLLGRSDHVRRSDVFPLPGGAEMTVTFLVTARSSVARRSSRRSRPAAREAPVEVAW